MCAFGVLRRPKSVLEHVSLYGSIEEIASQRASRNAYSKSRQFRELQQLERIGENFSGVEEWVYWVIGVEGLRVTCCSSIWPTWPSYGMGFGNSTRHEAHQGRVWKRILGDDLVSGIMVSAGSSQSAVSGFFFCPLALPSSFFLPAFSSVQFQLDPGREPNDFTFHLILSILLLSSHLANVRRNGYWVLLL